MRIHGRIYVLLTTMLCCGWRYCERDELYRPKSWQKLQEDHFNYVTRRALATRIWLTIFGYKVEIKKSANNETTKSNSIAHLLQSVSSDDNIVILLTRFIKCPADPRAGEAIYLDRIQISPWQVLSHFRLTALWNGTLHTKRPKQWVYIQISCCLNMWAHSRHSRGR